MIKLLPYETSVLPHQKDCWELGLCFNLSGRFGRYCAEVFLDHQMLPLPLDYTGRDSFAISPGGIELGLEPSPEGIEMEKRRFWFYVFWFTPSWLLKSGTAVRKKILFRWADPNNLPKKVSVLVRVYSISRQVVHEQELHGINTSDNLVKVVSAQRDSHFHFPGDSAVIESTIGEIHSILAEIQAFPDTTSWTFTWPEEVGFWESDEGKRFLAVQLAKMWKESAPESATRLALCPFSLSATDSLRTSFLEQLEVQASCFVKIAVITPERLVEVRGDAELIVGGFGKALGLRWDGLNSWEEHDPVSVFLEADRIAFLKQEHDEIWKAAQSWLKYRRAKRIEFSPLQRARILHRVTAVQDLARKLLRRI